MTTRPARIGLVLFLLYLALYLVFVLINAFAPEQMGRVIAGGLNLAILYGFTLISAAFILAMLYGILCRPTRDESRKTDA